jgi:hypothetical protein
MKQITVLTLMALLYLSVSGMDRVDQIADLEIYKQMVCDEIWPDYKNLKINCEDLR